MEDLNNTQAWSRLSFLHETRVGLHNCLKVLNLFNENVCMNKTPGLFGLILKFYRLRASSNKN